MNNDNIATVISVSFFVICTAIVIIVFAFLFYKYTFAGHKRITDYFVVIEKNTYTIYLSLNHAGRKEVKALRDEMTGLRIRDKMRRIDKFFEKQLYILFDELIKKQYVEVIINTHIMLNRNEKTQGGIL